MIKRKISRTSQIGLLALSVLLGLAFIGFGGKEVIEFQNDKNQVLMTIPIKDEDYFDVEFRHSVNKGLVIERYKLKKEKSVIYLASGWFENYGAGMMDTIGSGMTMHEENQMLRIDFAESDLPYVIYRSAGIANHKFKYAGQEIYLFDQWPYQAIKISMKKKWLNFL